VRLECAPAGIRKDAKAGEAFARPVPHALETATPAGGGVGKGAGAGTGAACGVELGLAPSGLPQHPARAAKPSQSLRGGGTWWRRR